MKVNNGWTGFKSLKLEEVPKEVNVGRAEQELSLWSLQIRNVVDENEQAKAIKKEQSDK